jgi:hypothetical protein
MPGSEHGHVALRKIYVCREENMLELFVDSEQSGWGMHILQETGATAGSPSKWRLLRFQH